MQKGQMIEDRHAESWGQVCWVLRCRYTAVSLLLFSINSSFTLLLFSLFFKDLLLKSCFKTLFLFYSLKSLSLDLLCPIFSLISSITQQQQCHSEAVLLQAGNQSIHPQSQKPSSPPSAVFYIQW
jgi:hypothetical protein